MRRLFAAPWLCVAVAVASPAAARNGWKTTADVGEAGLVSLALGKSVAESDWRGGEQFAVSEAATIGATTALKHAFPERRPNGADNRSFPSGHTSAAFAAAGYLHQRYGWRWGVPAEIAAAVVGVSRVQSRDHHWHDVVAGAALGEATAFILTKPRDDGVVILPWADSRGAGVTLAGRF